MINKYLLSPFAKAFLFALGYGILFYVMQFLLARTGIFALEPQAHKLIAWDVGFYDDLRQHGYNPASPNTGFFIFFPWLWRLTHLGIWGMSFLNIVFFSLGFAVLVRTLKEEDKTFWLVWLTLPAVYFAFIPYTESLFFLFGALMLYAVREKKYKLLWLSLFLVSLIRAPGFFLIPAFVAMELLGHSPRDIGKGLLRSGYRYIAPILLALAINVLIQYQATGIWFVYFKTQAEHWNHIFTFPGLPFSNIDNAVHHHWLSAISMLIDAVAWVFLFRQLLLWLKNKPTADPLITLSAGYLAMVLVFLVFFSPRYGGPVTFVMGANRYTIIQPFFFVFLHFLGRQKYTLRHILFVFLLANGFWALFGAFESLDKYITIAAISNLLILSFMLYCSEEKYRWAIIPFISFNIMMQLHFFQQFITPLFMD
ncbi:hypothetical protein [Taibaiella koreensis]|uniref:hypothetical protein n=1 Tax=Taibaiella koreensis TaxID=1268548 RepID=UPI000E59E09A|nr:hypothetical protein [Taibaiella koreensis]